jgi:hypothetical protein
MPSLSVSIPRRLVTGFKFRACNAWPSEFIAYIIGGRDGDTYEVLDIWYGMVSTPTVQHVYADALNRCKLDLKQPTGRALVEQGECPEIRETLLR